MTFDLKKHLRDSLHANLRGVAGHHRDQIAEYLEADGVTTRSGVDAFLATVNPFAPLDSIKPAPAPTPAATGDAAKAPALVDDGGNLTKFARQVMTPEERVQWSNTKIIPDRLAQGPAKPPAPDAATEAKPAAPPKLEFNNAGQPIKRELPKINLSGVNAPQSPRSRLEQENAKREAARNKK